MRAAFVLPILFLLTIASAAASWSPYFTVVDDGAPASEVVGAANFAASMKGSVAVSFSGRVESDIASVQPGEEEFLVIFSGKRARIAYDARSSTPSFPEVEQAARTYLERQGYEVVESFGTSGTSAVVPRELDNEGSGGGSGSDDDASDEEQDDMPDAQVLIAPPPIADGAPPAEDTVPVADAAPADDEPGVFTRLWRWFASIFG